MPVISSTFEHDARSQNVINIYLMMVRQIHGMYLIASDQLQEKTDLIVRLNEEIKKYIDELDEKNSHQLEIEIKEL